MSEQQLVRYDEMCHAIAECYAVDEVKELHDKALALEIYAKQAMNLEAERQACQVRLRAEQRGGELLAEMKRGGGGDRKSAEYQTGNRCRSDSEYAQALASSGINERTARRWQQLAAVPKDEFEDALRAPEKPSTNGILRRQKGEQPMDPAALWLWGRLRDFERDAFLSRDPDEIVGRMTETMQADVRRIAPLMAAWLESI